MEIVDKEKFEGAEKLPVAGGESGPEFRQLTDQEFSGLLEAMQNPVRAQQEIAVQIKNFLEQRMEKELAEKGILSDHTRRWVETYNEILAGIQKALYGDRSVNLHIHQKVTHSQIAAKIRKASAIDITPEAKE